MKVLRLALWPFSLVYGLIVVFRNFLFDTGLLRSTSFHIPVISVGNLAVGGAGKTPMTEYLISLLKHNYSIATLSRGYGRKTHGYLEITASTSAEDGGDEPVQLKSKHADIIVAVCEDRVAGIKELLHRKRSGLIILDDAYQHRYVKPGLSILLFDYTKLSEPQLMLPAGDLREPMRGKNRAQVLVITKAPECLSGEKRIKMVERLRPSAGQKLFFSYLEYADLRSLNSTEVRPLSQLNLKTEIFLLTGIANTSPLLEKLKHYTVKISHFEYPDHHPFTTKNIAKLANLFRNSDSTDKIIVTTEKDAQRLKAPQLKEFLTDLPVYYLPVKAVIHEPDKNSFDDLIENYAAKYLQNN